MRLWGWLAFLVPLGLYLASISPNVSAWDTAELQTVPYIFGIAHPTGFPLFVMLGWLFGHALPAGTVAWRMGFLSALCTAGSAWVAFALARRLRVPPGGALGAALLFAVGSVAWTRGTRAEVHTLATLEALVAVTAALAWYQEKRAKWVVLTAWALGLGLATHETIGLILPGVIVLVAAARRAPEARTVFACALGLLLPLLTYGYIPLRSAYVVAHGVDPTAALGVPPGRPYWNYGNPSSADAFFTYVSGSDFRAADAAASILSPATYVRIAPRLRDAFTDEFPIAALLLALVGIVELIRRDPVAGIGLGMALCAGAVFAYAYSAESDQARYALPAFAFAAVLCAYGTNALAGLLASGDDRARNLTLMLSMLLFVSRELWLQRDVFAQRTDTRFSDYVDRVRRVTPQNAILIAEWAYATPLAYAAYVQHGFGSRIVETAHPNDDARRIPGWAAQRPVYVVAPIELIIPGVDLVPESRGDPTLYRVKVRR